MVLLTLILFAVISLEQFEHFFFLFVKLKFVQVDGEFNILSCDFTFNILLCILYGAADV